MSKIDKTLLAKMNSGDVELAARWRARLKAHEEQIKKLDREAAEVKQNDHILWCKFVFNDHTLFDLPQDERIDIWEKSEEHKLFQLVLASLNAEILWNKRKIARLQECAEALLIDLTIED